MYKVQKIILVSLILISLVAWLFSIRQSDMMEVMMTLNSITVLVFTLSWTVGMIAMMFPAIVPMVLMYNRLVVGGDNNNSDNYRLYGSKQNNKWYFLPLMFFSSINYSIKTIIFISSYLLVWSLTGILLLSFWSILINNLFMVYEISNFNIVYGSLLIISGFYQFSSLKRKCLGYCESPLAFFTKRWKGNSIINALNMGTYHGLYCLGCCWPYFLLMIALGWMNIGWMGLFAGIIFGEKIWSRGIWLSRIAGIIFIIMGILTIFEIIILYNNTTTTMNMN